MKALFRTIVIILLALLFTTAVFAESTVMKFSDPSQPGLIKVIGNGNITLTGYNGTDVVIDIESKEEDVSDPSENERAKGLKRVSGSSINITHDKATNAIEIARSTRNEANLTIKVPVNTSFKTGQNGNYGSDFASNIQNLVVNSVFSGMGGGILSGDIQINNISGDIEASTVDGNIKMTNVSGRLLINSINGNIDVIFKEYKQGTPMAISTVDGYIDITLPSSSKLDLKVNTIEGELFTGFDLKMIPVSNEERNANTEPFIGINLGKMLGNTIYGKINGGGAELKLSNIDGDIYLRQPE